MADFRDTLLSKFFRVIPGEEFNRTWGELWDEGKFVYELVLPETGTWETFRDRNYPLFAKYLKSKMLNPEYPAGVVVAVFFKEQCYFLKGPAFIRAYQELEGVAGPQELHQRVLGWLSA